MSETDLGQVWARSLDELSDLHIEPHQRAWLRLTRPLGLVENTALIATPNEFVKEQLETRLRTLITHALSRELGRSIQLAVTVDPATDVRPAAAPGEGPPGGAEQPGPGAAQPAGPRPSGIEPREQDRGGAAGPAGSNGAQGPPKAVRPGGTGHPVPRPAATRLNPKYTFETFVIGSSNRFAH